MQNNRKLAAVFAISFLFFAHLSVVMYINLTVLSSFIDTEYASLFYILGAMGSVVLLFLLPGIVKKLGLVRTSVSIFALIAVALLILGTATTAVTFVSVFILYTGLSGTVWYCNDLFVAHYSQEHSVGHTRGSYLTVSNVAIAIMPIISGFVIERSGFRSVYILAASLLCIAVALIVRTQRSFVDRPYVSTTIATAWNIILQSEALRRVISINFLLQFFYVWMTLYTPLYLHTVMHFSWGKIGIIFTLMLTAFVLLQYAVGRWADRVGEKKLLIAGFSIAAISTVAFALLKDTAAHSIVPFALVLFGTRVGICMVEVLAETYFFKQVTDRDEAIVSVYRMMYPLAYIVAPLLGWAIIAATSYVTLFIVLGALLAIGALYTFRLVDIR